MKRNSPENRKYHYIYKITRDDGKYYIGLHSTDDLDDGYFGSGERLWKSINYHGKDKHTKTILEMFADRASLITREKEIVTKQLIETDSGCLNLVPGGSYFTRKPNKAGFNEKKSASLKAFYADKEKSAEARKKMSKGNKGKKLTNEHKVFLSKTLTQTVSRLKSTGEWAQVVEANRQAHLGKKQTAEMIAKRNVAIKKTKQEKYGGKYTFSTQARKNISQSLIGSERNAKFWNIRLDNQEPFVIKNITKWYRETGVIHRKDGRALKDKSGKIIGIRERL